MANRGRRGVGEATGSYGEAAIVEAMLADEELSTAVALDAASAGVQRAKARSWAYHPALGLDRLPSILRD